MTSRTSRCGPPGSSTSVARPTRSAAAYEVHHSSGTWSGRRSAMAVPRFGLRGDRADVGAQRAPSSCSPAPQSPHSCSVVGQRDAVLAAAVLGRRVRRRRRRSRRRRGRPATVRSRYAARGPPTAAASERERRRAGVGRQIAGGVGPARGDQLGLELRSPAAARRPAPPGRGGRGRAAATGRRRPPAAGSGSPAASAAARRSRGRRRAGRGGPGR